MAQQIDFEKVEKKYRQEVMDKASEIIAQLKHTPIEQMISVQNEADGSFSLSIAENQDIDLICRITSKLAHTVNETLGHPVTKIGLIKLNSDSNVIAEELEELQGEVLEYAGKAAKIFGQIDSFFEANWAELRKRDGSLPERYIGSDVDKVMIGLREKCTRAAWFASGDLQAEIDKLQPRERMLG